MNVRSGTDLLLFSGEKVSLLTKEGQEEFLRTASGRPEEDRASALSELRFFLSAAELPLLL